jgi:hypothetical protein
MSVSCECCVLSGRGLCVGLITRSKESTECGVSECDRETSIMWWSWSNKGCCAMEKKTWAIPQTQTTFYLSKTILSSNKWRNILLSSFLMTPHNFRFPQTNELHGDETFLCSQH